ncbi:MAG: type I-C CRISPR-associated protein Cas7/Csd2 [Muribaculaceae bacterium]|nr:type I-C CRISPR-associated protein Cas7/Csd2 [Muribaculaceae bacterium]
MAELEKRIDFIYIFDVQDGNPNGDPDAANLPRVDAETGHGLVTDVCLKRKIRNYVEVAKGADPNYQIFIKEAAVLDNLVEAIYKKEEVKHAEKAEQKDKAKAALCAKYYDIRTFGAVIATTGKKDQVRGAVQFTFGRSADPIVSLNHAITRMAVTKESERKKECAIGRKATVPYGLYVCHGFVNVNLANQTGFNDADLKLLWDALINMFDNDRSASRGLMSARKLIAFEHESKLGNAPANILFDLVDVKKKDGIVSPRSYSDYEITIDRNHLPQGVKINELI